MIFSLDEDHLENNIISDATRTCVGNPATLSGTPVQKPRSRSPLRIKSFTTHRRKHVRIFPLNISYLIFTSFYHKSLSFPDILTFKFM